MARKRLAELCYARSGDKGDVSNVGLLAFDEAAYQVLRREVTPARVKALMKGVVQGEVEVYELPNILALNVVMRRALGGGATRTLRFDQTGKSLGNALLRLEVEVPGDG
ncbi:MAG: hypothetical protein IRZ26_02695 [Clostridia bacterium]|nr:hypothetical protein [Clostridia bacterium]MCL6522690.1 hypothetical protein [Bacillota bacterium]